MTGFTDTIEKQDVRPSHIDEGDHDKFAHYADKNEITKSLVNGTELTALCGKVWIPTRDGLAFPVCPECKEIYESLPQD